MKTVEQDNAVKWVLRKQIVPDPEQPRKNFDAEKLKSLAENIEALGIQIPLLVRRGEDTAPYLLVDGERRWRAAELAKVERVPVIVLDTTAADWEERKLAIQVSLNQQRENLTALEEAAALKRELGVPGQGPTADEVAKRHGMSRGSLFGKLRLLELTEPVKKALLAGEVSVSVAGLVASVPAEKQAEALKEVSGDGDWSGPMPFRRAQERIESQFARQLGKAAFDTKRVYSGKGIVAAGDGMGMTCGECPKRSGNMEGSGLKNPNVCTQPVCFEAKTRAAGALKLEEAKKAGRVVIGGKEGAKIFSEYGDQDVNHSSGFVELDKRADLLGWDYKNHYRAALGDALKELPVTVAVDRNGVARELVKRADAEAALKESGKLKPAKPSAQKRTWKEERAERQAEEKVRKAEVDAIASAIVSKIEALPEGTLNQFWYVVAEGMRDVAGWYLSEPVRKRRGWEAAGHGAVEKELAQLSVQGMAAYAVELAARRDEDAMNAVCKALKIDQKAIAKEARDGLKKPKTNAKAASRPTCRRTPKSKAKGKRGGKGK